MGGPYACCAHCLATGELGTHGNPCGYRDCPGSRRTGVTPRARMARLLVLAWAVFMVGMIVARVVTR